MGVKIHSWPNEENQALPTNNIPPFLGFFTTSFNFCMQILKFNPHNAKHPVTTCPAAPPSTPKIPKMTIDLSRHQKKSIHTVNYFGEKGLSDF